MAGCSASPALGEQCFQQVRVNPPLATHALTNLKPPHSRGFAQFRMHCKVTPARCAASAVVSQARSVGAGGLGGRRCGSAPAIRRSPQARRPRSQYPRRLGVRPDGSRNTFQPVARIDAAVWIFFGDAAADAGKPLARAVAQLYEARVALRRLTVT